MLQILHLLFFGILFAQESPVATVSTPTVTLAPEPTISLAAQYKNDYLFAQNQFSQAYLDYTQKKQIHTRYGTIITQKEKLESTKTALISRNSMLRNYLKALRVRLDEYQVQNPTMTEKLKIDISKFEDWLTEQNTVVNSLNNDVDIQANSKSFAEKYVQMQQTIYGSLVQNQINANLATQALLNPLITELGQMQIKPEGQQLLSEIKVKLDMVNQNLKTAFTKTQEPQYGNIFTNFYSNSKNDLINARNYLLEVRQNIEGVLLRFV